ncbi:uncharacterized protein LOC125947290 [Dermacentor silvarum]|uniref:uncharacterized protein LOC125947290 n=1 Tax=Dermacentor silvarum TaxID=543639 RepID=UPI0021015300|nr:uncharacterized protein LOC125947290 [Dermacentor silvarum]
MSVWDIEVEEASSESANGPWYLLEKDTDGASSEDADSARLIQDSEDYSKDEEKLDYFKNLGDEERRRCRGVESFQRSPPPGDKGSGRRHSLLELADDVAPDLFRCAFDAGYVYLLTLLVERTPSEHSALHQMLSGVEIPVVMLSRAHLYVATARIVSWSVAKLRAIKDGLASSTLFLLVLLLAMLLLTAGSAHVVLLAQGVKGLFARLSMTAWLSTYEGCNKYLVCRPHSQDPMSCPLPAWCRVSRNSTTSDVHGIDAFVYEMLAMSDQGQLVQMIKEMRGESLEYFVRLYAFATCAWAFSLGRCDVGGRQDANDDVRRRRFLLAHLRSPRATTSGRPCHSNGRPPHSGGAAIDRVRKAYAARAHSYPCAHATLRLVAVVVK